MSGVGCLTSVVICIGFLLHSVDLTSVSCSSSCPFLPPASSFPSASSFSLSLPLNFLFAFYPPFLSS